MWRMERKILRSLKPTKKDLRVPSTIALEEVKAGMARVETSLKEEVEGLKATNEELRIKVAILERAVGPGMSRTISIAFPTCSLQG